ncbi:MAG: hypothetical protein LBM70_07230 [Victivallales bacterium]|nr:hypothetical protein [Victivallales bacterium]
MNTKTRDKLQKQIKKNGTTRYKTLLLPMSIGIPVIAILAWLVIDLKPEPLTADEILKKENWSEAELIGTLARSFSPQTNRGSRKAVIEHLRRQIHKYPESEQERIRVKALTAALNETLRQIRAMPENEQDKMYAAIQTQAEKWQKESQRKDGKERFEKIRSSEEGQAFNTEVTRIIYGEFTPEERRKFAPITDMWVKTLMM